MMATQAAISIIQRMITDIEAGKIGCVITKTVLKDADAFYQRFSSRIERRYIANVSQMQKESERLEARDREIDF